MGWVLWLVTLGGLWTPTNLQRAFTGLASVWRGVPLQTACGFDAHEPDEVRAQAGPLDGSVVLRTCRDDVDWFEWDPTHPGLHTLRIQAADGGPAPVIIELFAPRKRRGRILRPDRQGVLRYRVRVAGGHRLRVRGLARGDYRLWPPQVPALPDDAAADAQ